MFNKNLYNNKYHNCDLGKYSFLITGGAGFIGSNLVEYLLKYGAKKVRVLDNLSNGYYDNIKEFIPLPNFEFIEGDIRDLVTCHMAVEGMDFISHQAALGSVPRSVSDPLTSNEVNITGFLNMLEAAKDSPTLKQMVYAASSSTYGDSPFLPKVEGEEGSPLSPYAVTKLVNELYADVYSKVYGFHTIGLRYFNIFGPKQNPNNPYAAVIPIFCQNFIEGTTPTINGDGTTSRDFTFVENAVQANIKTMLFGVGEKFKSLKLENLNDHSNPNLLNPNLLNYNSSPPLTNSPASLTSHQVFNVACGDQIALNEMVKILQDLSGQDIQAKHGPERDGDVRHSRACLSKLAAFCGYIPTVGFAVGLGIVYGWYREHALQKV